MSKINNSLLNRKINKYKNNECKDLPDVVVGAVVGVSVEQAVVVAVSGAFAVSAVGP